MANDKKLKLNIECEDNIYGHVTIESYLDSSKLNDLLDFIRKSTECDSDDQDEKWKSLERSFNNDFFDKVKQYNALDGFKEAKIQDEPRTSSREKAISMFNDKMCDIGLSTNWNSEICTVFKADESSFSIRLYSSNSSKYSRNVFGILNKRLLDYVDYFVFVSINFDKIWVIPVYLLKGLYAKTKGGITVSIKRHNGSYKLYVGDAKMNIDSCTIENALKTASE